MSGRRLNSKRTIESFFRRKENVDTGDAPAKFPIETPVDASSSGIQAQHLPTDIINSILTEASVQVSGTSSDNSLLEERDQHQLIALNDADTSWSVIDLAVDDQILYSPSLHKNSPSPSEKHDTLPSENSELENPAKDQRIELETTRYVSNKSNNTSHAEKNSVSCKSASNLSLAQKRVEPYRRKLDRVLLDDPAFKDWLIEDPRLKNKMPFCRPCGKPLKASNRHDLYKHSKTPSHISEMQCLRKQLPANDLPTIKKAILRQDGTKALEIALSAMIAKKNQPMNLMRTLPKVLKKHVPDSQIVQNMKCSRTKTTGLIKNVIAPAGEQQLIEVLKDTRFSIIVDESTDRTLTKFLVVIVRYYSSTSHRVVEEFFSLPVVTDGTAAGLKALLMGEFERAKIPISNIIGFASDNASVMLGNRSGLATMLKKDLPWLAIFGCICHSFALCSEAACDKLDPSVLSFSHDVYNFLSFSSKRLREYRQTQEFVNAAKHAILYPSKTRWLVMENVSKRLVEQWDALELYFKSYLLENVQTAKNIYYGLTNPSLKLHYYFLSYILETINKLNLEFQSTEIRIHKYLKIIGAGLKTVMNSFLKEEVMRQSSPFDIDHKNPNNIRPLNSIYYGANAGMLIRALPEHDSRFVNSFQLKALDLYIELCSQIKSRVNHMDPLLKQLECISPTVALNGRVPSIAEIYLRFKDALSIEMDELDQQWRAIPLIENLLENFKIYHDIQNVAKKTQDLPKSSIYDTDSVSPSESDSDEEAVEENEARSQSASYRSTRASSLNEFADLPASVLIERADPVVFWNFILSQRSPLCHTFETVVRFMQFLMSLPHSSAGAERQFSKLKLIKTPQRNRISPQTITAIMHIDRFIPDIENWEVPDNLIKNAKKWK